MCVSLTCDLRLKVINHATLTENQPTQFKRAENFEFPAKMNYEYSVGQK